MEELDPAKYTVVWLAPLEIEAKAALSTLDHRHHGNFPVNRGDDYIYLAGDASGHNVVIATIPPGVEYGTGSAAALASQVKKCFPNIWFGLLVGVAAGVPNFDGPNVRDIRLGDVLVALRQGDSPGLIAYDLGKETTDGFEMLRKGDAMARTEPIVSSAIGAIKLDAPSDGDSVMQMYRRINDRNMFPDPGEHNDKLHYQDGLGNTKRRDREPRPNTLRTRVWYGSIASGDKLVKNSRVRDALRERYDVIGIEMEAAGIINRIPVGVIRGVCDYGDEHKNKDWQPFAAATAAAYAMVVLSRIQAKKAPVIDSGSSLHRLSPSDAAVRHLPEVTTITTEEGHLRGLSEPLKECLKSIAFQEMHWRLLGMENATESTCEWLLQHSVFQDWTASQLGLLCIKGSPGSGKSTLLRFTLERMNKMVLGRNKALHISFFFHGRGSELQKNEAGLYRSLLHQLLSQQPEVGKEIAELFKERCTTIGVCGEKWEWHQQELQSHFYSALASVAKTRSVWLYIDALDEAGKVIAAALFRRFRRFLHGIAKDHDDPRVHICTTCRHYPNLDSTRDYEIHVQRNNSSDIALYIKTYISQSRRLEATNIPGIITQRANGIFLWARIVVSQVLDMDDEGKPLAQIMAEIQRVPAELDDLYTQLLKDINERAESLNLFEWLCFSTRPLSLGELYYAMAQSNLGAGGNINDEMADFEINGTWERRVKSLSRGLAETALDREQTVQFIHQSVKDYFMQKGINILRIQEAEEQHAKGLDGERLLEDRGIHPVYEGQAHYRLARACIRYLKYVAAIFSGSSTWLEDREKPFFRVYFDCGSECRFAAYATKSWSLHAKQSEINGESQEDLVEYLHWPPCLLTHVWVGSTSATVEYKYISSIHTFAEAGLITPLKAMIKQARGSHLYDLLDSLDKYDQSPLALVAQRGYAEVVELLLQVDTVVVDRRNSDLQSPLSLATKNGHEDVVKLLLATGIVNVDVMDKQHRSPLFVAAENGHDQVVKLLLATGMVNVDAMDTQGRSPLFVAAENGHEEVVKLLLATGIVNVDAMDKQHRSPLFVAAENGHDQVVKLLLATGAVNVDATDTQNRTPLSIAAMCAHEEVVKLLLATGAVNVDATDTQKRTPLSIAAMYGHEKVVKLLLATGMVNVNAMDMRNRTPLALACAGGRDKIVSHLLAQEGILVNHMDRLGRTPLFLATERGHDKVVRQLATITEINPNLGNVRLGSPLLVAIAFCNVEIVKVLLLDIKGTDVNSSDTDGRHPLICAIDVASLDIAKLLLGSNAIEVNRSLIDGLALLVLKWTRCKPTDIATKRNLENILDAMLDSGKFDINQRGRWQCTPVMAAARYRCFSFVELLVNKGGANVNLEDTRGKRLSDYLGTYNKVLVSGNGGWQVQDLGIVHASSENRAKIGDVHRPSSHIFSRHWETMGT